MIRFSFQVSNDSLTSDEPTIKVPTASTVRASDAIRDQLHVLLSVYEK